MYPGAGDPGAACVIAVDVGGTTIKSAALRGPHVEASRRLPTPQGAAAVVSAVAGAVEELAAQIGPDRVSTIGVVVPGIVDERRGVGVRAANLGWADAQLAGMLDAALPWPVAFGHDVRAGALAEYEAWGPSAPETMLFVPIGTGIAMGAVLSSQLLTDPYSGELGHAPIGHTRACACGLTGCLEAIASARAIAERYAELTGEPIHFAQEVADRVRAGEPRARLIWEEAVDALAQALAWTASLLAPQVIVLGGGLAQAGESLLSPLSAALGQRMSIHRVPQVVTAYYGTESAIQGAALLARRLTMVP